MTIKNKNLPSECLPLIPDAEFAKVTESELNSLIQEKYADETTPEANAYRKIAKMFASSQKGGIGAPKNITYWAWRTLTDEDEHELFKSEARFVISAEEMDAPIFKADIVGLDEAIQKIDAGQDPSDSDKELLDECRKLVLKWIDVAVRTKSNRSGLKKAKVAAA